MANIFNIGRQMISGAIGFEVVVNPGVRSIPFPDLAILRGKTTRMIDICDELSLSPTQLTPYAGETKLFLMKNGTQKFFIDALPGEQLKTSLRKGNRILISEVVDLPKSYILLPQNNADTPRSLYFVFWYDEPAVLSPVTHNRTDINSFEIEFRQRRNYFKENQTLRDRRFQNILLSFPTLTAENREGIAQDTAYKSYLTLQRHQLQFFQQVPLYLFDQTTHAYTLNFENIQFDFTNSFLEVISPTANDLKSVFFNCIIEA